MPHLVRRDECNHQNDYVTYIDGHTDKAAEIWNGMNATGILQDYLYTQGVGNWTTRFFGGGFGCDSFPRSQSCTPPQQGTCESFDVKQKYFIEIALTNFMNTLMNWDAALDVAAINTLLGGIDTIVANWGPPAKDETDILALITGTITTLTSVVSPEIVEPLTIIMDVMDRASEMTKAIPAEDPAALEGELRDAMAKTYKNLKDNLKTVATTMLQGERQCGAVRICQGKEKPTAQADRILKIFKDGVYLDGEMVNRVVSKWIDDSKKLLIEGLTVTAWNSVKYPVVLRNVKPGNAMSKDKCPESENKIWDDTEGCFGFGKLVKIDTLVLGPVYDYFTQDDANKANFTNMFQAVKNAYDCHRSGGNKPQYPPFDVTNPQFGYPPCFFNVTVEVSQDGIKA